jgi:hypothetical protein
MPSTLGQAEDIEAAAFSFRLKNKIRCVLSVILAWAAIKPLIRLALAINFLAKRAASFIRFVTVMVGLSNSSWISWIDGNRVLVCDSGLADSWAVHIRFLHRFRFLGRFLNP